MIVVWLLVSCLLVSLALGAAKLTYAVKSTVVETLSATAAPFGASGAVSVTHSGLNAEETLDANSAAGKNVTVVATGTVTLVAGAASLNLAALHGTEGTVDLTGLKVRTVHLRAKSTNANPITVTKGAANGYTGLGAAFSVSLEAGKPFFAMPDATAVAAGVRLLDVTGTGTQALEYIITAGNN